MSNSLKILVIDDTEIQREAAKVQLKDHDLTIVGDYDAAADLLHPKWDDWSCRYRHEDNIPYEQKKTEWEAHNPGFDVVLTDLMMPPGHDNLGSDTHAKFAVDQMPVGMFLAMMAACKGVKFVGIVSDTNHHVHPAGAALARLPASDGIQVGDARMYFAHCYTEQVLKEDLSPFKSRCEGVVNDEWQRNYQWEKENAIYVKSWKKVLDLLLASADSAK